VQNESQSLSTVLRRASLAMPAHSKGPGIVEFFFSY
jgi:hypothetical protein